jgi:hypothetical protein
MTHSGGKPHAVGDRGQRYEITVYDEELQQRRVLGWAESEEAAYGMAQAAEKRPSWSKAEVNERVRRQHPHAVDCRSCGAKIVWFNTPAGKKMPVDEATTLPTDAAHQIDLKRHVSHFATCPNANQHRRPR